MSHITDIFLLTNCSFDPEYSPKQAETIQRVQDWLKDNCNQQLKRLHNRAIRTALTKLKQYFNMKQN